MGSRPLSSLAGGYRDDGIMIIGLGIADALALMVVFHSGPYYLAGVIFAAVVLTIGPVVLLDRKDKWLSTAVESSATAPTDAPVRRHQAFAQRAFLMVAAYGAVSVLWPLLWVHWWSGSPPLWLVPGTMIAQGVTSLVRAERVRSWERDHNSELLSSFGWRRRHKRGYFVRPATQQ